jgi:hypothetical protein
MAKKNLFSFLLLIITLGIIYIFIFIYIYFNLDSFVKYNFLNNKNIISFYEENSKIVHHLRHPRYVNTETKNPKEFIFSHISKNESKELILFQGDSWFEQIYVYKNTTPYLKSRFKNDFNVINAGTSSYSPSLMSAQFDLLTNKYNLKPTYLIVYIDQTDLGDENCRYKNLKKLDSNNKIIGVPFEEYPYYGGLGIDLFLKHSKIIANNQSNFFKTQAFINYKITKSFYKIKKNYEKKIKKKKFSGKCPWEKIEDYLIRNNNNEINYFKDALLEYVKKIDSEKNIKKVFIVTHPHKHHLINKKLNLDVSTIVEKVIDSNPKFKHINFSEKINKNKNLYDDLENIWIDDLVHLKEEFFIKVFLKEIVDEFYLHKSK